MRLQVEQIMNKYLSGLCQDPLGYEIYFTCTPRKEPTENNWEGEAVFEKKTWKVIGGTFHLSQSKSANQITLVPVKPVGGKVRLTIGVRLLMHFTPSPLQNLVQF